MISRISLALMLITGGALIAHSQQPDQAANTIPGAHRLTHLRNLVGDWASVDGTGAVGKKPFVRYTSIANGRAIVERISVGAPDEIMNVYHLDGRTLQVTQFSPYGSHPTLTYPATADRNKLTFERTGGASLDPAVSEFIQSMELRMKSPDELDLHWVRHKDGVAVGTLDFTLRRMTKSKG